MQATCCRRFFPLLVAINDDPDTSTSNDRVAAMVRFHFDNSIMTLVKSAQNTASHFYTPVNVGYCIIVQVLIILKHETIPLNLSYDF